MITGLPQRGHGRNDHDDRFIKSLLLFGRETMTQGTSRLQNQPRQKVADQPVPCFKPVALPALAAAVQAAKAQARKPKAQELPPILRKEAVLG
jgi:hypothetical protein